MFNDYLDDTRDKINSLDYCLKNDTGGASVNVKFIDDKLSTLKLNILFDINRINKGKEVLVKSEDCNTMLSNMNKISKQYTDLYSKVDKVQKSLENQTYPLPSQLVEYLVNV